VFHPGRKTAPDQPPEENQAARDSVEVHHEQRIGGLTAAPRFTAPACHKTVELFFHPNNNGIHNFSCDGAEMRKTKVGFCLLILALCGPIFGKAAVTVEGAPENVGFNVGSVAAIRAVVKGFNGDVKRLAVFAQIQYVGKNAMTDVQMDFKSAGEDGEGVFEGGWPIPADAPTGLYSVTMRVEDRREHSVLATRKIRDFMAYKKLIRISDLTLNKTFYNPGETIQCGLSIENLTDREIKDLRVEFSNSNYPWISLFAKNGGKEAVNPELGLKVLRDHVNIPAHGSITIPMMDAGTARFMQGLQREVMGAGAPARHEKVPPPEVDQYTLAVWNGERTVLYDMQFSAPAIVRPIDKDVPKPYGRAFTHTYNSDIDFVNYRHFYPLGLISPAITVDQSHTLYRPGDAVEFSGKLKNVNDSAWNNLELHVSVQDSAKKEVFASSAASGLNLAPAENQQFDSKSWTIPADLPSGTYSVRFALQNASGTPVATTTTEIAVNRLPASLLVTCPHEDDEIPDMGIIRAALEANIPVKVVIFVGGDVGECERYYDKPCTPTDAREFGMVRMEETTEGLEHMGLPRDKLFFLGLPDGGSGAIWSQHPKASDPFMSVYMAVDHAPYPNVVMPNLPYARESVLALVEKIIAEFHPAMIVTAHPDERHVDHRTTGWFVLKACEELLKQNKIDPNTIVLADQAYGAIGAKSAPYNYEPAPIFLSGEVAAEKQEASWIYQSQDGNIAEGMKKTYEALPRSERHLRVLDWQEHEGWNE
jgi:LmbE family N-acetylglucosaminyl deacetylase